MTAADTGSTAAELPRGRIVKNAGTIATHGGGVLLGSAGLFGGLTQIAIPTGSDLWHSSGWLFVVGGVAIGAACMIAGGLLGSNRLKWLGNGAGIAIGALLVGAAESVAGASDLVPSAGTVQATVVSELMRDAGTGYYRLPDSNCSLYATHDDERSISSNAFKVVPDDISAGAVVVSATTESGEVALDEGSATVRGRYGMLTIQANGDYTYTLQDTEGSQGEFESFPIRVRLAGGDMGEKAVNITIPTYEYLGYVNEAHQYEYYGTSGNDTLTGTSGVDTMMASDGNDWLFGKDGNDTIFGGPGNDIVTGGLGEDQLFGEDGDDRIYAGERDQFGLGGKSLLDGGNGDDFLVGNAEGSVLLGGRGDDVLVSPYNNDAMTGGSGADIFALSRPGWTASQITDFSVGQRDKLDLTRVFGDRPAITLANLQAVLRTEQMDQNTMLYARNDVGTEKLLATLQGIQTQLPALFATGALQFGGQYFNECDCE
nr:calcium-binding protein [uncultured Devosia sp.]